MLDPKTALIESRKSRPSCSRGGMPSLRNGQIGIGMNDDYADIYELLVAKREELANRLERLKANLTAGRSADSQEQAQELENAEVVDALGNEARLELSRVARALDQIKNGTYGTCVSCAEEIPLARLKAYPFADRCIRCATAQEARGPSR
jgi:RNA polymerase-binding protein DksA